MKPTILLLTVGFLQVHATGLSQNISFSGKNVPLSTVFVSVEKQTDVVFVYTDVVLKASKPVTVQASNMPLTQFLSEVFKTQPLVYEISGKNIFVSRRPDSGRLVSAAGLFADSLIHLRGRIVNKDGKPVDGATIAVQGSRKNAISNADGQFSLDNIRPNAILEVSHVQYESMVLVAAGRTEITIALKEKISALDELQVIAYGQTTKRFQTGNVSTVKSVDIERQPVTNPLLALQGRMPGVYIEQSTGLPDAGVKIRIQGENSLSHGNDPLYVVDGVPYTAQLLQPLNNVNGTNGGGVGSPLSYINPNDILSIDILKDADATAIYGSRAANGAVLITTKKGKAGPTVVGLNMQQGWGNMTRRLPVLNERQYLEMRHEAFRNDNLTPGATYDYDLLVWDTTRNIDWQKKLLGNTAQYTNSQLSVSGGNAGTTFLISGGFHRETSVFPGDQANQKGSLLFNLNHQSSNGKLKLQFSGNYMYDNNQLAFYDLTGTAIALAPDAPELRNSDGTLNWAQLPNGTSTWFNPLAMLETRYSNIGKNLIANVMVEYRLFPGFTLKSRFGYTDLSNNERILYSPSSSVAPERRKQVSRSADFGNRDISSWIIEPQAEFEKTIGEGKLVAIAGVTINKKDQNGTTYSASGFSSDYLMQDVLNATSVTVDNSLASVYRYNALFGRVTYNWQERYILNLSARRDGSSAFGSNNLFHNFGSVGAAWVFSSEKFFGSKRVLSYGKLRGSYGTTGNDQIGYYQYLNLYNPYQVPVAYQGISSLLPVGLPNPYLQWEETRKLQFGLDLGFFSDRLLVTANYYRNRSSNQLQNFALPLITGNSSIQLNLPATVENTGVELAVTSTNVRTNRFQWTTSANLTMPANKLVAYPNLSTSTASAVYKIGSPINLRKLYAYKGVDPATGLYVVADKDGKPTTTPQFPADAVVAVSDMPKFFGGLSNTIRYGAFELDFTFQFVKQMATGNYFEGNLPGLFFSTGNFSMAANQPEYVMNRWQKPGDVRTHQQFSTTYGGDVGTAYSNSGSSSINASDASYIRLKNAGLSWSFPNSLTQKLKMQNARVFVQGQNLLTITKYYGLDPETKSSQSLPPLRVVTVGAQVNF